MKNHIRLLRLVMIVSALSLSCLMAGYVFAQVSANFDIHWNLLSGGGGSRASANYKVDDALGQWEDGASSSVNYRVASGFWGGVATSAGGIPILVIGKSAPAMVGTGTLITYTLYITNSGPVSANSLVITDAIPSGASYISGGMRVGTVVSWTFASLAPDASATFQFVVTATQTITNSQYRVSASGGYSANGSVPIVTQVLLSPPDSYEPDDTCGQAKTIPTNGSIQTHNFHIANNDDWVKFTAQANKTYVIKVDNVGPQVDAVVMLYAACDEAPLTGDNNAFGSTIEMDWDAPADGVYYLQVMQNDPAIYGVGTNYDVSVAVDTTPPSPPTSLRVTPADRSLIIQWRKSPERDVAGYRVYWGMISGGPYSFDEISGADNTYFQTPADLINGVVYYVAIKSRDLSGNWSAYSGESGGIPTASIGDTHPPTITLNRPSVQSFYTTTVARLTVGGACTDNEGHLSRIRVSNDTLSTERWNYGLAGTSMTCLVESVPITYGLNTIQVNVFDTANNMSTAPLTVTRVAGSNGAVVIVGGHNTTNDVQTNINYMTNRAYNVFRMAGFGAEDILYLSPTPQDPNGDGVSEVISPTTPGNVHAAVQWAASHIGADAPFYLYLMDHGNTEIYCADGCGSGAISSGNLHNWLDELETTSGNHKVTVIIEACHSGSFIDKYATDPITATISTGNGRVVIVSTGRTNNAYASAQGAYFSDAFFTAVSEGKSLQTSFDQAKSAAGLSAPSQTPWLDDNGDGLSNPADGTVAGSRYVASFFGGSAPDILTATVKVSAGVGTLSTFVERGDDLLDVVWAAIYAPSFHEPTGTTLSLGVPLVELHPDLDHEGLYSASYNGFTETGSYKVVVYALDKGGNQALPKLADAGQRRVYLPLVLKQ